MKKLLILLILISPVSNADDIFTKAWDWAKDNPEISIPSAVVGVPVAVAAAPMIASYVLFPFVSVASGLMPEFSSEVAGTVSRASVMEIDGLGSGATRTVFSRAEIIAQRATYDAAFSENLVNPRVLGGLILDL